MQNNNNLTQTDFDYIKGNKNTAVRYYYYVERGLEILNIFRNLGLAIFALYIALKLTNPLWLLAMIGISLPLLMIIGYYNVHLISKMREWLNIRFSTHYGIKSFDYQKRQVELLEEIKDICQKI